MALRRWKLGSYEFEYNPHSDSRQKRVSEKERETLSGAITNPNQYYEDSISIAINLYDKPTHYGKTAIRDIGSGYYFGISEKRVSGELYCLRSGAVDVIRKDGNLVRSIPCSFSGTPVAIAHMDDRLALFFSSGTTGTLYIADENCNQISKYIVTDPDYVSCSSLAWDYKNSLYVLCKFGKIFKTDYTNGTTTLIKQMDDYELNHSRVISAYKGIHFYKGFCGFISGRILTYMDSDFNVMYGNEIPKTVLGKHDCLAYGAYTGEFTALTENKMIAIYPDVCGVEIERIRQEIKNGIVLVTDEKGSAFYFVVENMSVERKRNMQDARYEITLSGQTM